MTTDNLEKFQQKFQAGQTALERGNYRLSIEYLEAARELIPLNSRRGGEVQIWLLSAYQAADKIPEAIALCQELILHPNTQTREQAQRILYIIKAPKLERPKEWMSEIPDLRDAEPGLSRYVAAKKQTPKSSVELPKIDLERPPSDSQDNQFIWFALFLIATITASLLWLGKV
ncbi:outer membrane protein assembly factor BamD [Waterburya agarophytonicola K14]|uniref:Outer membrane protein assembly factor BamD n=1 Tax=Waterburya agarophytonicola KI4 TaxID=2874699 RepID=A0A964BSY4_9CYAN|nr:outer membrane protein assembly factor BamD [Waterburya agarophytonicola KI4]